MDINEALSYIHSNVWTGGTFGIDLTLELLKKMGNPEKKLKFVHIAGTNGKGSTAAMTASILQKAGYRVGLYTSPYIISFNERIQINGENISDDDLIALVEYIRPMADTLETRCSEFELITCMAMKYYLDQKCDIVVLEVGLGGALDSTNCIECPEAAVMVNIGYDHMQILGNTLEEIAGAKAGIIKDGCDCVVYHQAPSIEKVFADACAAHHATMHIAGTENVVLRSASLKGQVFDWEDLKGLEIPLLGEHQLHNAATVLKTIEVLRGKGWKVSERNIRDGLRDVTWPGRFQIVREKPLFIIDGGHNPQCLDALTRAFRDYIPGRKITFLNGCMRDKDFGAMFEELVPFAKEFVTVTPNNPRALNAKDLKEHLKRYDLPVTACDTIAEGVRVAVEHAGEDGVVCSCGSLYMISEIMAGLENL